MLRTCAVFASSLMILSLSACLVTAPPPHPETPPEERPPAEGEAKPESAPPEGHAEAPEAKPEPAPEQPKPGDPEPKHPPRTASPEPCETAEDCVTKADRLKGAGKHADALGLYERACNKGHAQACFIAAATLAHAKGVTKDKVRALPLYKRACDAGAINGCYEAGMAYMEAMGTKKDPAMALDLFKKGCGTKKRINVACYFASALSIQAAGGHNHADAFNFLHRMLNPYPKDPAKVKQIYTNFIRPCGPKAPVFCMVKETTLTVLLPEFTKGCKNGIKPACEGLKLVQIALGRPVALPDQKPEKASDVPDANLKVGAITVNKFQVKDLQCRLQSVGFTSAMVLVASLAKNRGLKRCGPKGQTPRVVWESDGKRTKVLKIEGTRSRRVQRCIRKKLTRAKIKLPGKCSAVLVLGK